MRRILILLLVLVLPLRLWAGDTMAVAMAAGELTALHADATLEDMPSDCPMHQAAQDQTDECNTQSMHGSCNTCQLCTPLMQPPELTAPHAGVRIDRSAEALADQFVSADLPSAFKPPLSSATRS